MKKVYLYAAVVLMVAGTSFAQTIPTSNLTAYWSLDDTTSDIQGNNGTLVGTPSWAAGKINRALGMVSGYMRVPYNASAYNFSSSNSYTISAWIMPTALPSQNPIFNTMDGAGNGGYTLGINSSGQLQFVARDATAASSVTSNGSVSANTWSHIAVAVTSPTSVTFYINGAAAGSATLTRNLASVNTPATVGFGANTNSYFQGAIDEVRVYSAALTSTDITNIYNSTDSGGTGEPPPPPPPTTYSLTVTNNGNGTVSSSPSGISCGSTCSVSGISSGTSYVLTATPNTNYTTSWSGCATSSGNTCNITVNSNTTITATFTSTEPPPPPPPTGPSTYTICSSGCTATTITGFFGSRTPVAGDVIEVRADTPGGSKTYAGAVSVTGNGSSGNPIILRSRAGDNITIDANGAGGNALIVGGNYYTVDGFRVQGAQGSQILIGKRGSCSNPRVVGVTVQNSTTYAASALGNENHEGIMVSCANNTVVRNNTMTTSSADLGENDSDGIFAGSFNGLLIEGNTCTISNSTTLANAHNDCVQIMGANGSNFGSVGNVTIRNNTFIHNSTRNDYKQGVYIEYEVIGNIDIYNNVFMDTRGGDNLIQIANKGNGTEGQVRIFNNSFYKNGDGINILTDNGVHNPVIKNNVILYDNPTSQYNGCVIVQSTQNRPADISNNICFNKSQSDIVSQIGGTYYTFSQLQAAGYNLGGFYRDPGFVNTASMTYDLHTLSTSIARGNGANLTSLGLFRTDRDGNSRPSTGAWDVGAYQSSGSTPPPVYSGPDIYIAQSQAGTADASSCANAKSVTFFNTSSNWGTGSTQIGPGKTVHLCGTFTTSIDVKGSGTASNPIVITFEPGARFSAPTWTTPPISIANRSYVILDGTNGIIEATNNGANLTYHNKINGVDITASPNCEIKNLTIRNLYVRPQGSTDKTGSNGILIDYSSSNAPSNNTKIHDNTISEVENGIMWAFDSGSGARIYNNKIKNMSTGIIFGSKSTSASYSDVEIYNNDIADAYLWDEPSDFFHHDGIHIWAYGTTGMNNLKIYNNFIHGNWGVFVTAQLFFEGTISSYYVYNNVLSAPFRHIYTKVAGGRAYVFNNTIHGAGFAMDSVTGSVIEFRNNIYYLTGGMGYNGDAGNNPGVTSSNNLSTNPTFVNIGAEDFRLQNTSAAINAGVSLATYFTFDKDGISRPQGTAWDIGAYEYAGSTPTILGDFNGDRRVNSIDFSYMNSNWNTADATADLNKDGRVNTLDFSIMSRNWTN